MDNPTSFQQLVDDMIKSASFSMLRDSSIPSFSSIIDSAIKSTSTSSSTGLDRMFRRLGLSGPEDFEITPPPSQHHHLASSPSNTLNSDESKSSQSGTDTKIESRILKNGPTPPIPVAAQIFKFRELAVATNNFSPECLLEVGEFNRLYRGLLESTGQVVAVKQFDQNGLQENWEFWVEILMHHLLHHPNLVNLIGYCADGGRRLLVYEFMPLGSLEDHLFDLPRDKEPLDWNTRMKIASGAAKGLEYLHDKSNPPVIYRNLKPSDILLDESYHPKLSDFGLAKLGPVGDKTLVSKRVMGTYVYIDPEYVMTGQLSLTSDVYCFGVVLLELITGRKAIDDKRGEPSLIEWARPLLNERNKFFQLADPLLQGRYPMEGLYKAVEVAAMCIHDQGTTRPPIRDVVTVFTFLVSQTYG